MFTMKYTFEIIQSILSLAGEKIMQSEGHRLIFLMHLSKENHTQHVYHKKVVTEFKIVFPSLPQYATCLKLKNIDSSFHQWYVGYTHTNCFEYWKTCLHDPNYNKHKTKT